MAEDWAGDIVFSDSVAIYRGQVGDNRPHAHWAVQVTIALEGELEFETEAGIFRSAAVCFASRTLHRLAPARVCSVYFDPLNRAIRQILPADMRNGWLGLASDELPAELASINEETDLRALLNSPLISPAVMACEQDERFEAVIREIRARLAQGEDVDRKALAAMAHLSPTRFSHWFVERAGIPVRSYKKWLKLRMAMDALLAGAPPDEAAMNAGFSDLAHLCRAFSESFGLTYLDARRILARSNLL